MNDLSRVSVVLPSLDPDDKLVAVVDGLLEYGFSDIILINDGSKPENLHYFHDLAAQHPEITLLHHEVNKGKGAALGMRKLRRAVHRFAYHMHVDIRNCYGSMQTAVVEGLVARYVKNSQVLYLLHSLLSTMDGVLILGSYLSLRLAAFVISFAYHAVEEAAKERRGKRVRLAGCQVWYADDGYFLGNSKRSLRKAAAIAARVLGRLGLSLKPWKVRRNGAEHIDFAGYRIWCARGRRVDLRKRLWKRLRRAFARYRRRRTERLARRVCSYWGWLKTAVMEHQMNSRRYIFNAARAVG